ncbi:hypothetical protein P280DRAFT_504083 [Massarina eburnea CBS 473.64]|uniref:Uncharacterized protein n=1 Tax=Massarina eburnea CBS 473.64 TaxID=1395130 RepID=A0A6A6SE79_9PLEO|nr:hypothetical protein P280DRAFT_504083 [Massarina eburnea CBS 473.64]
MYRRWMRARRLGSKALRARRLMNASYEKEGSISNGGQQRWQIPPALVPLLAYNLVRNAYVHLFQCAHIQERCRAPCRWGYWKAEAARAPEKSVQLDWSRPSQRRSGGSISHSFTIFRIQYGLMDSSRYCRVDAGFVEVWVKISKDDDACSTTALELQQQSRPYAPSSRRLRRETVPLDRSRTVVSLSSQHQNHHNTRIITTPESSQHQNHHNTRIITPQSRGKEDLFFESSAQAKAVNEKGKDLTVDHQKQPKVVVSNQRQKTLRSVCFKNSLTIRRPSKAVKVGSFQPAIAVSDESSLTSSFIALALGWGRRKGGGGDMFIYSSKPLAPFVHVTALELFWSWLHGGCLMREGEPLMGEGIDVTETKEEGRDLWKGEYDSHMSCAV